MLEMWVQSLGREDPLEKDMATHSSILARKLHEQRSLVGYSPWGRKRVRHNLATKQCHAWEKTSKNSARSRIFPQDGIFVNLPCFHPLSDSAPSLEYLSFYLERTRVEWMGNGCFFFLDILKFFASLKE